MRTRRFYKEAKTDQTQLLNAENDQVDQIKKLRLRLSAGDESANRAAANDLSGLYGGAPSVPPVDPVTRSLLAELDKHASLPEGVKNFLDDYVHDSRAGFGLTGIKHEPAYQRPTAQLVTLYALQKIAAKAKADA